MFFQENGQYRCAVYLRLSRSDGDQQESNSIKNQRALLNDYMGKHPELHKFDEYVDDGYSGTNFERPDFKRMMQDIEKRNVNCIIVKDLSRFGRNYIETGRYLERIFPFMGVRFIAINDHYDSAEENDDKGRILIPFNNLINDTYCRDISLRVRSHLDVKRKEGQFIGSFAGYGYRKDPKDKNHLIIDEYAAGIVQEMQLLWILSSAVEEPFRLPLKHCRGRSIRLVSNLQLWKMTFVVQTKLPKKLQSISMERPLIRFVRNLLPIARITLKKVH